MTFTNQVNRLESARLFARGAHSAVGQVRKYTGVPYYTHPEAVAAIVSKAANVTDEMIMAAYLHDVIEDTGVSYFTILETFGHEVARLVLGMTKHTYPEGTKRKEKVQREIVRLNACCDKVKTIKIADSIHNMSDFIQNDPDYACDVYLPEKRMLLDNALEHGDPKLWSDADKIIKDFYATS